MKSSSFWCSLVLLGGWLLAQGVQAAEGIIQFSADAIQRTPDRPPMQARIHVGAEAVRSEYKMDGQKFIEIVRKGERVLINPARKEYLIQPGGTTPLPQQWQPAAPGTSPCRGVPGVTCRMLGKEMVNGRETEKWEFVARANGHEVRSLHWIDVKKRFPLRQLFPDGSLVEMRLVGQETLDGRKVEKWEMRQTRPDGQSQVSWQWHDPQLHIVIREELPGGYVRELKHIRIGSQDPALFRIPADYRPVTPPAAPPAGR